MNLLIVEDEERLRNSLVYYIPWEEHGIQIVGAAETGEQALQFIERRQPDIVLLDIEMPDLSGLVVAKHVCKHHEHIKMIVLSGHDDFQSVQKAMEFGVSLYLLKPAGTEQIIDYVSHVANQLKETWAQQREQLLLREKWEYYLPSVRDRAIGDILKGKYDREQLGMLNNDLQLGLMTDCYYAVATIEVDDQFAEHSNVGSRSQQMFVLSSMIQTWLAGHPCWVYAEQNGTVDIIFELQNDAVEGLIQIHALLEKVLGHIRICLQLPASAGICGSVGTVEAICTQYYEARIALKQRHIYGSGIAIPYQRAYCAGQGVRNKTVQSIVRIVNEEMEQEVTLHGVAERLFVNASYLSRLFKQEMGTSFSTYVIERKMERAKHILLEGAKVYDAAYRVGYRDVSYFTKVFRKHWGVTPGNVKQKSGHSDYAELGAR
ncbi:response regulator transcription factor [Paenibacillus assamensis]|uniref:response regulator transcription factor n=1 Tax=Paenibacillus assamensis TaxID=311244 RepID=UPI00040F254C|nr:response regulator [Paenibacillus assamensis]